MFKRQRRLPIDEIVSRGKRIYDEKIRSQVEPEKIDKIVAIDVESGNHAIADESKEACQVLIDRSPGLPDLDSSDWPYCCGSTWLVWRYAGATMITGNVTARLDAVICLHIEDSNGVHHPIDFVVDTRCFGRTRLDRSSTLELDSWPPANSERRNE